MEGDTLAHHLVGNENTIQYIIVRIMVRKNTKNFSVFSTHN